MPARQGSPKDHPDHLTELDAKALKKKQVGNFPVPPKYTRADFLKSDHRRLRGKLDVPKECWESFPHCEGPHVMVVVAWSGDHHLQLALAISAYYVDVQERLGGRDDPRLVPPLLPARSSFSPGGLLSSGTMRSTPSSASPWAIPFVGLHPGRGPTTGQDRPRNQGVGARTAYARRSRKSGTCTCSAGHRGRWGAPQRF